MAGLKNRLNRLRARYRWLDRTAIAVEHYLEVQGAQRAGAVTYFGFLSFFPILALAFFVVGKLSVVYPDARRDLVNAIDQVLPAFGLSQDNAGGEQLTLDTFAQHANTLGLIGLLGVLYTGLGWLSSLRAALVAVFAAEEGAKTSFVVGKLRDLMALVLLGVILMLSVAVAGLVTGFSADVLDWLGWGDQLSWLVALGSALLGLAANVVLFFALFKVLARAELTPRELLGGALLGAIGFEALKQGAFVLLASTEKQPAFQVFGIALILLVWIYYFSQLVLFSACWSATAPTAVARAAERAGAEAAAGPRRSGLAKTVGAGADPSRSRASDERWAPAALFSAGAAAGVALAALVRRKRP